MKPVLAVATALLLGLVAGCSADAGAGQSPSPAPVSTPAASSPPSTAPAPPRPTPSPTASATPKPKPPNPISMQALIERRYDGRDLDRGRLLVDAGPYKRYAVTYRGDGERILGIMNVPDGKGPFPVLVLNHGYINPATYWSGQGMPREQDYLARQGYVVLHIDYRNHAGSSNDTGVDYELRLPYVVDTINAVLAVKGSEASYLDGDRVGWLGRSMGGEVTLRALAAKPGLVDAGVVYASVSSNAADNWKQWYRGNPDRAGTNRRIDRTYGLPDDSPDFWRAASARPYLERVTEPVMVHHGTADDTCPIRWSDKTVDVLDDAGVDVTYHRYRGEGHTFEGQWRRSIERTTAFFDEHLI